MDVDVAVIGSGHNGLVTSFYCGRAGLRVEVFEANEIVGGACRTEELIPGYTFSTCANYLFWARARVFEDMVIFDRGVEAKEGIWSHLLPDNRGIVFWPEEDQFFEELGRIAPADREGWKAWQQLHSDAVRLFGPYVLSYPPTLPELLERAKRLGLAELADELLTSSLAELVDARFQTPEMRSTVVAPLDIGSMYDHGGALVYGLATAVHGYSETGRKMPQGYVRGGMGCITRAMQLAAADHGVTVRLGAPVRRVIVEDRRAVGVELADGEVVSARAVISNADPKRTLLSLIDADALPDHLRTRVAGLSTDIAPLKLHCALSEEPEWYAFPNSSVGNAGSLVIAPSREYQERAWYEARQGELPTAPIMWVMVPSTWDTSLAPEGHHTVSIFMLFAPVRPSQGTWDERRSEMAERIFAELDRHSPNLRRALLDYVLLTPADLDERMLLTDGNIHHIDIVPRQMLWRRPLPELAHYRTPIEGLYLCGVGQHPYGEVSGACGHNCAHAVLEDLELIERNAWQEIVKVSE
jgi:phytoene dehydrogenase-like protein